MISKQDIIILPNIVTADEKKRPRKEEEIRRARVAQNPLTRQTQKEKGINENEEFHKAKRTL